MYRSVVTRLRRSGIQYQQVRRFRLDPSWVETNYAKATAPFGFNGLGELVYYRTYAREKDNGLRERWYETVERVVNGTFSMQETWMTENALGWDENEAHKEAKEMFDRIFHMKFLPPGRGLWCMGTTITEKRGLFAALNNCAFISTNGLNKDFAEPFCFTMDASMLGVGVGFDTKGAGLVRIATPPVDNRKLYVIPDTREGWVESLQELLYSYDASKPEYNAHIEFDYSKVRPANTPIKGFGGTSSGPEPLIELHHAVRKVLDQHNGSDLSITGIVDIMNLVGRCVVSGNVRRTAEIAFGDPDSLEYIQLKDYEKNPEREAFGWTSNNSVFAKVGMDYSQVVDRIRKNGEPGFAWLENMRNYGRMNGKIDDRDWRVSGGNPCLEQSLESHELCCLVETFPNRHESSEDFLKTLESAFLYAKTVTLGRTHWPKSNRVMLRNRRIGCSMSGIAQFVGSKGLHELKTWCNEGYDKIQECDEIYSERFAIPKSIKTTSIKPSGTVSLLAGATPGIHAPESRYYIRRMRLSFHSELIEPLLDAGYHVEPAVTDPDNTAVVSFPVDSGEGLRTVKEMTLWEQLSLASFLQEHWADNQVSCTVTFDPKTESSEALARALEVFQYKLKGVSFLPRLEEGAYEQMPYEEISETEFHQLSSQLLPLNLASLSCDDLVVEEKVKEMVAMRQQQREQGVVLGEGIPDGFCDACQTDEDEEIQVAQ